MGFLREENEFLLRRCAFMVIFICSMFNKWYLFEINHLAMFNKCPLLNMANPLMCNKCLMMSVVDLEMFNNSAMG